MNIDSARDRIKIIEGLVARILADHEGRHIYGQITRDAESIQRQCAFLALDLKEEISGYERMHPDDLCL